MAGVRGAPHEDAERHVDQNVRQQTPRRPEQQHQTAAQRRPQQDREVAAGGVEPDRTCQLSARHHVVNDELRRRRAHDAGGAVDEQDDDGMPRLERAGQEEHPPRDRRQHEQSLGDLYELAAVEAIRERAGMQREQQERRPVTDDREPRQRRRVEHLEYDPVADDVLDVVGRHRQEIDHEVPAVRRNPQRGEPWSRTVSGAERLDRSFHTLE